MAEGSTAAKAIDNFIPGKDIGASAWVTVDQALISAFGAATLDPDPMHVDPAWAARRSPFGQTLAFGFLTVSLLTHLLHDASGSAATADPRTQGYFLNYGFDRLRLISPVLVGARVRGRFRTLDRRIDAKGRHIVKFEAQVEIEGETRPALAAEWLTVWVPPLGV
jgi:acyl dehydratase